MLNLCRLTAAIMLLTSLPSYALINSYNATYQIIKHEIRVGTIEQVFLRKADSSYTFTSTTKPYGIGRLFTREQKIESSVGKINGARAIPFRYENKQKSTTKSYSLNFQIDRQKIVRKQLDGISADHFDDLHDSLSYQLQLCLDMHNPSMDAFNYKILKKKKIKALDFRSLSTGELSTVLGNLDVKILLRQINDNRKKTKIWAASKFSYLPVKILNVGKNGEEISIQLLRVSFHE
jgi:hypothetical protein